MAKKVEYKIYSRMDVVDRLISWLGKNEADGSHKDIIDKYNDILPLPRGYKVKYKDAWCAATVSAVFHSLGYDEIFPLECGCNPMIQKAKEMHIWVENDSFIPEPGDVILYDWNDSGKGDNSGEPDHVGIVLEVYKSNGYFVVGEGNYKDSVKKRTVNINGRYIRGFITPAYTDTGVSIAVDADNKTVSELAHEVILGKWGSGKERAEKLKEAGYNYSKVQKKVNEILNTPSKEVEISSNLNKEVRCSVLPTKIDRQYKGIYKTMSDLHLRDGAGTNKKALVIIPKGTAVQNYGYYTVFNDSVWLYVQTAVNGIKYTGFCHMGFLRK